MADGPDKEQRTEPATGKRRQEARSKGMVARSQDLNAAVFLTAILLLLVGLGAWLVGTLRAYLSGSLRNFAVKELTENDFLGRIYAAVDAVFPVFLVLVSLLLLVGAATSYGQVGFQISTKAVQWDLSRINPVNGFKNLFRLKALVRAGLAVLKAAVIVTAAFLAVKAELPQIALLDRSRLEVILPFMGSVLFRAGLGACLALLAIGVVDFFYERWQYEKDLRMTKQEVKEEHRQQEGDPAVKGKLRRKQQEIALRRMMADVPKATVVVTNPTHYAVALKYKTEEDRAPKLLAKGKDLVAKRIREIAEEHGVPIVENPPLAQGLYKTGEVGQEIPPALYRAVAEILSYVFRLRGRL